MNNKPEETTPEMSTPVADRLSLIHNEKGGKINWPLAGSIGGLVLMLGGFAYANLSDSSTEEPGIDLIPAAAPTPRQRRRTGPLFGEFPASKPVKQAAPVEDPKIAALEGELAAMKTLLDKMQASKVKKVAAPLPEPPDQSQETVAALAAITKALTKVTQELDSAREDQRRQFRALEARMRAKQVAAATQETNPSGSSAEELADRRKREQEREERAEKERKRLASPSVISLGNQGNASNADGQASSATGNAFLDAAGNRTVETARARTLPEPHRLVTQGTMVGAILETAINSDLPGLLRARVKQDIWSADGSNVLIQSGSTLIGEYQSEIGVGQSRILVVWNRVITPDHRSVMIGSRGVDRLGRAGLTGKVDHHFALKFEAAFLISVVSAIAGIGDNVDNSNVASAVGDGGDALKDAGDSALEEYLSIPPTIHVDQGDDINVFVARDLYL
ncbi:TrbI/VirB10 family protein [Pelagibius sp. Alg239-R121]|uniref:TrbI/VirB10 family protein n=1 Tax=Pelagibius sp. Alg239-R121 TaxID=2993448 RepID=UPI0024A66BC7|nr:TrbI/VirB10 family protein [Pelagibius sp. Alg239-R121]